MAEYIDRELGEFLLAELSAFGEVIKLQLEREVLGLHAEGNPSREAIAAATKRAADRILTASARISAALQAMDEPPQ